MGHELFVEMDDGYMGWGLFLIHVILSTYVYVKIFILHNKNYTSLYLTIAKVKGKR